MSDTRIFEIYRYDPDVDKAPRMETYELELKGERMLLDALISPITRLACSARSDCGYDLVL